MLEYLLIHPAFNNKFHVMLFCRVLFMNHVKKIQVSACSCTKQSLVFLQKILLQTANSTTSPPINNSPKSPYGPKAHIQTNTDRQQHACLSLALICELFAMIVDPHGSSNKPGQVTNHSTETAGNGPNLQEEKRGEVTFTDTERDETLRCSDRLRGEAHLSIVPRLDNW